MRRSLTRADVAATAGPEREFWAMHVLAQSPLGSRPRVPRYRAGQGMVDTRLARQGGEHEALIDERKAVADTSEALD